MKLILAKLLPGNGVPVAGSLRVDGGRIVFRVEQGGKTTTAHIDGIEAVKRKSGLIVSGQGAVRFTQEADGSRALEIGFVWPDDAKDFRQFAFTVEQKTMQFEDDGGGGFVLTAEALEFDCFEQAAIAEKSAAGDIVHAAIFPDGSSITRVQNMSDRDKYELAELAVDKIVGDLRQQAKSKLLRKATPEEVAAFATDWIARHGGRKRGLTTAVQHEFGIKHNSTARARLKAAGIK